MESPAPLTTNHGRVALPSTGARHINNGDVITWRGPDASSTLALGGIAAALECRHDELEHRELSAQLAGIGRPGAWKRGVA